MTMPVMLRSGKYMYITFFQKGFARKSRFLFCASLLASLRCLLRLPSLMSHLYSWIAHERYMIIATLTTSNTWNWTLPNRLSVLHASFMFSALMNFKSACVSRISSRTKDSPNPSCENHRNMPILRMLYSAKMIPSPSPVIMICSFMMLRRSVFISRARSGVDENMASQEIISSRNTITHTTLSPSILSMKFHNPFLTVLFSVFSISLKISDSLLELSSSVFIVLEQVKACTAR